MPRRPAGTGEGGAASLIRRTRQAAASLRAAARYVARMDRERAIDELYARPAEEFVAARDELARALRSEGEREAADAVKRLRRPSHAAAIVNRLARDEPELAEALL